MHPVGAGQSPAPAGAPDIPRRARERSAQSKTAENLPIPRSPHIADFAPLSKTPGAGGKHRRRAFFTSYTSGCFPRSHPPLY